MVFVPNFNKIRFAFTYSKKVEKYDRGYHD
jgi:hypothetical protein